MEEHEQKLAVLEECRSSVDQEASMLRSSRRELEKSRLQARRELQELRRQVEENVLVDVQQPLLVPLSDFICCPTGSR